MGRNPDRNYLRFARLLASAGVVALAAAPAGCSTVSPTEPTASIATHAAPRTQSEWRKEMTIWGQRYRADTSDSEAAIRYAQALRGIGQRAQATAVLEQATMANPQNQAVLG